LIINLIQKAYLIGKQSVLLLAFKGAAIDPMVTINATDMAQEVKGYSNGSGTEYDWGAFTAGEPLTDRTLYYSIRRERRCELMAEGLRWMDLVRWRSLDQLKKQPYHFEGFHLWNTPMEKNWYTANQLNFRWFC
jgi:hypothetical protein